MKTTWTTRHWMKLIDEWMGVQHYATVPWKDVLRLEGGYGGAKIKTIADAKRSENEGTWPAIWFRSDQTDFSVYSRHDYIYSLLFGRTISKGTISIAGRWLAEHSRGQTVDMVDWGGTVFTAIDLLELLPLGSRVTIVNFNAPQMDFAKWVIEKFALTRSIYLWFEDVSLPPDVATFSGPVLLSETLEHLKEPVEYLGNHVLATCKGQELFIANSFCTPAYGHFVPVIIDGKVCPTTRKANLAFREAMERMGYAGTKLPGWNSRAWRWVR